MDEMALMVISFQTQTSKPFVLTPQAWIGHDAIVKTLRKWRMSALSQRGYKSARMANNNRQKVAHIKVIGGMAPLYTGLTYR
jgi:hypothetical protein